MDGNGNMNYRNWGFYEPPGAISGHLGLQLMSGSHDKPLNAGRSHPTMINTGTIGPYHHMPTNNGFLHHRVGGLSESPMPSDFVRDSWINSREKYFNGLPSSHQQQQQHHHSSSFSLLPESSGVQEMQMLNLTDSPDDEEGVTQLDEIDIERDFSGKKRPGGKNQKSPKSKKLKKGLKDDGSVTRARAPKKSVEIMINGIDMDISSIPIPVCTCTGASQQCYRWGSGGWQSACCTTGMSIYPLPMSAKRRGTRIAGRKMSIGAFKKVLEKLASEGYNFSRPIDLKTHWAKHGTNKFVTIR